MNIDALNRKTRNFVLWAPRQTKPKLVIGTFQPGAPPALAAKQTPDLIPVAGVSGLFEISPAAVHLQDGTVYHYWFEVDDTNVGHQAWARILVSDPTAFTTDWRLTEGAQPASVSKFENGQLVPCDPDGTPVVPAAVPNVRSLPQNNQMVIYELPAAWTRRPRGGGVERGVGTFRDIVAMVDAAAQGVNFDELEASQRGRAHIFELGINAIELLPPADSLYDREWVYGTSHMFAPDYELGYPEGNSFPTANADLRRLLKPATPRTSGSSSISLWGSPRAGRISTLTSTISISSSIATVLRLTQMRLHHGSVRPGRISQPFVPVRQNNNDLRSNYRQRR